MSCKKVVGREWVFRKKERFSFRARHLFVDDDNRSSALKGFIVIFRMIDKYNIAVFYLMNFINAGYGEIGVAIECAASNVGDFAQ